MENKANTPFSRFESLGDNCEFGFFLRQAGNEISSLFRWTSVQDFFKLNDLIKNGLDDLFNFNDLTPLSEHMVMSKKHAIGFHTRMKSHNINGKQVFKSNNLILRGLFLTEIAKINHLRKKFINGITSGNKIYVVKGANSEDAVYELAKTISFFGQGKILHVVQSSDPNSISTLIKIDDNLYKGYIDRFANYNSADQLSFSSWEALLTKASKEI